MPTAATVLSDFAALPADEKANVAAVISLGPPPPIYVGPLWIMVVGGFILLLLGSAWAVYHLVVTGKDPKDVVPIVTAALGVLAGLLAPSPFQKSK
jgi:hypothetical protein